MSSVAVIMPTYNHGPYIAVAIESFLAQKTSFPCRLYISDDCSTDNTADVAERYALDNPDKVTLIRKTKNEGLLRNYKTLLDTLQEDYVAVLESDDYWTDELKLQKQFDYMQLSADCGLCFTGCNLLINGELQRAKDVSDIVNERGGHLYSYLLLRALVWSPTIFFRRSSYLKYCNIDDYIERGFRTFDAPLILSIAANCSLGYISDVTAVYRISSSSISNNASLKKRISFERGSDMVRSYVISLYGRGGLSRCRIFLRRAVIYLRIVLRYLQKK